MTIHKTANVRSGDNKHLGTICLCDEGTYAFYPPPGDDNSIYFTAEDLRKLAAVIDEFSKQP